jgi:hypothetical protein
MCTGTPFRPLYPLLIAISIRLEKTRRNAALTYTRLDSSARHRHDP